MNNKYRNKYSIKGKMTFAETYGRLPTPKKGSVMKPKKGKGSYKRNNKHKGRYHNDERPFLMV